MKRRTVRAAIAALLTLGGGAAPLDDASATDDTAVEPVRTGAEVSLARAITIAERIADARAVAAAEGTDENGRRRIAVRMAAQHGMTLQVDIDPLGGTVLGVERLDRGPGDQPAS